MTEIAQKINSLQQLLESQGLDAVRLKGVDWFAWATGGADSSVIFSNETGVAEVLITRNKALVLTNAIEVHRMRTELISSDFEIISFPWTASDEKQPLIDEMAKKIASDRPNAKETLLTREFHTLKWTLSDSEIERYRKLGKDAAEAATEALDASNPSMTEIELAGQAAHALWKRGIHPLLTLVGGERRSVEHRHPVATPARLENHAMLVICGRRNGLFANLTRHVFFRAPSEHETSLAAHLIQIEQAAFLSTREHEPIAETFKKMQATYVRLGYPHEIELHHQGGPTGYLSREAIANPGLKQNQLPDPANARAFAWNPSLSGGAKLEDTILLNQKNEIEVLTRDPKWPLFNGRTGFSVRSR